MKKTPKQLGYTFPPEWARQRATWFSWPRPEGISFPAKYHTIPANIAAIIREIVPRQIVCINVPNANWQRIVTEQLIEGGVPKKCLPRVPDCQEDAAEKPDRRSRVQFHYVKTNESWCRDHGPAFVVLNSTARGSGKLPRKAIVDWGFNAWGGKYPPFDADDAVPTRIAEEYRMPIFYPTHARGGGVAAPTKTARGKLIVMEGGAVEFNGRGTVLTTTSCLLNNNRNPGLSKREIETALMDYYGQSHVCWLGEGIVGDDTDGHIDDLARFLDPKTIAVAVEDDPKDDNFELLRENLFAAGTLKDQDGEPFRIVTLPMPRPIAYDGQRLPATYLNFLFVNGACLVPTFRDKRNDKLALATLQEHLPKHRVIGVDCFELIWGLGAIHCLTQQEPA
ncbi:MAG: agmatine deiminase family protein [Phycisphaerales bacterium]|nr:agmatine deiminase family protein [Phycisphaerales bacterium]